MDDHESFLARWSRLKRARREPDPAPADAPSQAEGMPGEAALEHLEAGSDFARFLGKDVDPDLRTRALRMLWNSEPELAKGDGLIDYAGDYTGAGSDTGIVMSAYRIGRGLLSDDEAALWVALGRREPDGANPEAAADNPAPVSGPPKQA